MPARRKGRGRARPGPGPQLTAPTAGSAYLTASEVRRCAGFFGVLALTLRPTVPMDEATITDRIAVLAVVLAEAVERRGGGGR